MLSRSTNMPTLALNAFAASRESMLARSEGMPPLLLIPLGRRVLAAHNRRLARRMILQRRIYVAVIFSVSSHSGDNPQIRSAPAALCEPLLQHHELDPSFRSAALPNLRAPIRADR